jgi:hypothetical protein
MLPDAPFVTVHSTVTGVHTPVLMVVHPHGFRQISDRLEDETSFDDAYRAAKNWAKTQSLEFKEPHT